MTINFILGACWASFFNLVIQRHLRNESILLPTSHCDSCHHRLAWYDLIPIVSFLILHGRCRYCHAQINTLILQTELLLGVGFALIIPHITFNSQILILILFAYLAIWDCHTQTIPSWPLGVWLGLCLLILPWQLNYLKLLPIYLLVTSLNHLSSFIGSGDIDILFLIWLTSGPLFTIWVLFLACVLSLVYLLLVPRLYFNHRIAFVPFLFCGYALTTNFTAQLLTFTIP